MKRKGSENSLVDSSRDFVTGVVKHDANPSLRSGCRASFLLSNVFDALVSGAWDRSVLFGGSGGHGEMPAIVNRKEP